MTGDEVQWMNGGARKLRTGHVPGRRSGCYTVLADGIFLVHGRHVMTDRSIPLRRMHPVATKLDDDRG